MGNRIGVVFDLPPRDTLHSEMGFVWCYFFNGTN